MINSIKNITDNLIEHKKMTNLEFGEVVGVSPLVIKIDQKKILEEDDLLLSHLVKDYYVDITVQHSTDSIYGGWDTSHSHPDAGRDVIPIKHEHEYVGRKKIIIHNKLEVGEKVVLLRQQGGQLYYVLDRINDPIVKGEWI